ncbi:MAG TPA: RidA family protein [Acidimicrobiales bacterium]|nr:RidA family protein [Acidimicrobiales bacterium]
MSRPVGPYSPFLRAGDWVVTSGQVGIVTGDHGPELVPGGTEAELRQALANVASVLAEAGAEMSDVVTATLYLVDMADYRVANEVWIEAFGDHRPARTAVAVASLPIGARAEVAVFAYVGERA